LRSSGLSEAGPLARAFFFSLCADRMPPQAPQNEDPKVSARQFRQPKTPAKCPRDRTPGTASRNLPPTRCLPRTATPPRRRRSHPPPPTRTPPASPLARTADTAAPPGNSCSHPNRCPQSPPRPHPKPCPSNRSNPQKNKELKVSTDSPNAPPAPLPQQRLQPLGSY